MKYTKYTQHLHFNKLQRNAVISILCIGILLLFANEVYKRMVSPKLYNSSEFEEILCQLEDKQIVDKAIQKKKSYIAFNLKSFDPNTVTKEELIAMGVREKTAKTWTKYTEKGGRFKSVNDLKKIYGLNDYLFNKLKDYVSITPNPKQKHIAKNRDKEWNKKSAATNEQVAKTKSNNIKLADNSSEKQHKNSTQKYQSSITEKDSLEIAQYNEDFRKRQKELSSGIKDNLKVDINSCDTLQLIALKGIGAKTARRIIEYRDKLGGYHHEQQFLEVYGINAHRMLKFRDNIIYKTPIRKINVNLASKKELVKHPYINWTTADVIVNYRSHHGHYQEPKDLLKTRVVKKSWVKEITPYLDFSSCTNNNGSN